MLEILQFSLVPILYLQPFQFLYSSTFASIVISPLKLEPLVNTGHSRLYVASHLCFFAVSYSHVLSIKSATCFTSLIVTMHQSPSTFLIQHLVIWLVIHICKIAYVPLHLPRNDLKACMWCAHHHSSLHKEYRGNGTYVHIQTSRRHHHPTL